MHAMLIRIKRYIDPYSSLNPSSNAFFGNLAFVLHLSNKTRIGCANFTAQGTGYAVPSAGSSIPYPTATGAYNSTMTVKPTGGAPITPTASAPSQFTGAAVKVAGGAGALLAAAVAMVL
jgi:hypothetical protein